MFQPFKVPFNEGIRQDNGNTDAANGETFTSATNVMYTKKGAVRGRFGLASENALVQKTNNNGGPAIQDGTQLNTLISGKIPAGIETNDQQLFAMWQGSSYVRTSQQYNGAYAWKEASTFWSTKKYNSTILDNRNVFTQFIANPKFTSPAGTGSKLLNIPITVGASTSLAVVGDSRLDLLDTQSLSNYDSISQLHACIATSSNGRDVILYPNTDGSIRIHSCNPSSIPGSGTEVLLFAAGTLNVTTNAGQSCWIVPGPTADEFFFAINKLLAGSITICRFDASSGTVTATLNLTGLGTDLNLGITLCHNGLATGSGGALCLGFYDTGAANIYKTKIINCTNTATLTNAVLDINFGTGLTSGSSIYYAHTVGTTSNGKAIVSFVQESGGVRTEQFYTRSFTSTLGSAQIFALYANQSAVGGTTSLDWRPFIPGITFCGRTVIGVYKQVVTQVATNNLHTNGQWILLDITDNIVTPVSAGAPRVVACGQPSGSFVTPPINAYVQSNSTIASGNIITFGVVDGILFDAYGIATCGGRKVRLQATGTRQAVVSNLNMFSGTTLYTYDGMQMTVSNFIEGSPIISFATNVVGGSATASASYSFQSTWEFTNGKGQVVRSPQSNIFTVSSTGANKQFTVTISTPQLLSKYLTAGNTVTVKLYATQPNPSGGAPLYLVGTASPTITNGLMQVGKVDITVLISGDTDTTQEQLYTGGNVFDDQAAPSADRGIAFCNNRLWVADQDRVYVSKLLGRTFAPAFNTTSGKLIIEMPTSIGEIESLGALDNKLAVIGSLGTAIIYGPGFDDLGNGPGWIVETTSPLGSAIYSSTINQYGPRIAANIPNLGVAFVGNAGELYQMNFNGQVGIIGRPMMSDQPFNAYECTYVDAGIPDGSTEHGPMILSLYDKYKVIDVESARACEWTASNISQGAYTCSLNGVVYIQQVGGNGILSMTTSNGQDLGVNFTQTVVTGLISVTGTLDVGTMNNMSGRLRAVTVLGTVTGPSYTQTILVTPDSNTNTALINKSTTVNPASITSKWPWSATPEFRATIQRCNRFTCQLTATPAIVEWSGIECWASINNRKFPSRNRS